MFGDSLGYIDGKVLGSDEGIKLGSTDAKVIGTILGNVDGIILGLDVGTELGSLDGPFDGSNNVLLEGCSCCHSCRLSCYRCFRYPWGRHNGRHCCRSSRLNMAGSTRHGRGVDVWRYWVPCNK